MAKKEKKRKEKKRKEKREYSSKIFKYLDYVVK